MLTLCLIIQFVSSDRTLASQVIVSHCNSYFCLKSFPDLTRKCSVFARPMCLQNG